MLSILIPTYNQDISGLVSELHRQAMDTYVDFEIIVMEDGSTLFLNENKSVKVFERCIYIAYKENSGRSAIRNRLADKAKYEHLLFIDCDAEINSTHFVEKYISFCKEDCVVIGGTTYDPNENNPNYSLRLKYGRQREARSAMERGKNNFSTFNFMISKSLFNSVRFDETIRGYGHEDMLFGHHLHELEHDLIQIENPLIHKGLDTNSVFLQKTEEATRNLLLLWQTNRFPYLPDESKLLHYLIVLKRFGLHTFCAFSFDALRNMLRHQLCSPHPSLLLFDLYKILYLCKVSRQK